MRRHERLSVSVPHDVAEWTRARAIAEQTTVSAVVTQAIRRMSAAAVEAEMVAGLLEDAADEAARRAAIQPGFAGHGSHRPGYMCLECDRLGLDQPWAAVEPTA